MPCVIALIIFSILGIFSASHRSLAKEAFDCVFKRITLRPCNSGFKEKIKSKVLSKLIDRSVFLTRIVNKHYELLSWIFFILMFGSMAWVIYGGYNFYVYGSCNGLNESGFCAFDPSGKNNKISEVNAECGITQKSSDKLTLNDVDLSSFPTKNITNAKDSIVFIGCYACDYSRKAYPDIQKLITSKKTNFVFAHFPAKGDTTFLEEVGYCVYKDYKEKYWDFNNYLFTEDKDFILDKANINEILGSFNFDVEKVNECANSIETKNIVEKQVEELKKTGLYGTPTIFINGKAFVGPKPYRVYRSAINKFIFF
ncbi:MAG TPA: thioredoxin domain-containing protein [Candidatus Paceibacterota bacterium]|nr:thioredoxin domain-containing protein [Candidatus Paceibacterota bacterium]HPT18220.1 thioredoxin domain-containing protein [Candidatus Paceibacterota bacterium]